MSMFSNENKYIFNENKYNCMPAPPPRRRLPRHRRVAQAVQALVQGAPRPPQAVFCWQIDKQLQNLKEEVAVQDAKHCKMRTSRPALKPNNSLVLANFAQFLYLVQNDHDRYPAGKENCVRSNTKSGKLLWFAFPK
ncbi:hypothetical protein PVAP13_6NG245700 [Panicum virgatum]|uniref:Uncharacterized protein n=1 Tax=Panicum virgatum TaxID=38727 RepID=A0A8T0R2A7_PANVG|nr:hypothetical protein PVAP13_6NG245700 [Panicum virgatum]